MPRDKKPRDWYNEKIRTNNIVQEPNKNIATTMGAVSKRLGSTGNIIPNRNLITGQRYFKVDYSFVDGTDVVM